MPDCYCTEFEIIKLCRFFAVSQQSDCKGFVPSRHDKCCWWVNHGGELYHCTNPAAQAAALSEIRNEEKKEGDQ